MLPHWEPCVAGGLGAVVTFFIMTFAAGLALTVVGVILIFVGKPRSGTDVRPFLRSWEIGIVYSATTMMVLVAGIALIVTGLTG